MQDGNQELQQKVNDHRIMIYLGSRLTAALLGFATIAVFTRLASPSEFGFYILVSAWAFVVQGVFSRWLGEAFFARYKKDREQNYFGTVFWLSVAISGLIAIGMIALSQFELLDQQLAIAISIFAIALTFFDLTMEMTRTRLDAKLSALVMVLRAILVVGLGSAALLVSDSKLDFVIAIAIAHLLAITPAFFSYFRMLLSPVDLTIMRDIWRYGWPLIIASGTWGIAQNVDRLFLGEYLGEEALGAYGALMNFLKQSYFVFGEVVAFSLISQAKRFHHDGKISQMQDVLNDAMRSITLIAVFGTVFVFVTRDIVLNIILGPAFQQDAKDILLVVLLASAALLLRTYYYGQIVYFLKDSWVSVAASFVQILSTTIVAYLLIPEWGAKGAALAFFAGQVTSCVLVALWKADGFSMPIPYQDTQVLLLIGLLLIIANSAAEHLIGSQMIVAALMAFITATTALFLCFRYDLFALREMMRQVQRLRHRES